MSKKEKIKCYSIFGIELFVNPAWQSLTKKKKIDSTYKVIHGEFFYASSLEDCQIIVSDKFINKFIAEYDLILNVVKDQFVWTRNTKETEKKLYRLELEVEFMFIISENENLKPDFDGDLEDVEYIFKLIE